MTFGKAFQFSRIAAVAACLWLAACQSSGGDCVKVSTNFTLRAVAFDLAKHSAWIVGLQNQPYCPDDDGALPVVVQTLTINLNDLTYQLQAKKQAISGLPATPSGYKLLYYGTFSPLSCLACDMAVRVGDTHAVHVYADPQALLRLDLHADGKPVLQFRIDSAALVPLQETP